MEQIERDKEKKGSQSQDSSSSDNIDAAATGGSGFNWKAISSVPSLFSPDLWILQFTISWILHLFKVLVTISWINMFHWKKKVKR